MTILVPRGAEARAVRRSRTEQRIVEIAPGYSAAAALPPFDRDETVLVLGLCGALRDRQVGDIVIYRSVATDRYDGTVPARRTDGALAETLAERLGGLGLSAFPVVACTTDRVVTTRAERRTISDRYAADVVDMESAHLAAALTARSTRFAMIRVVSDDASRDLPAIRDAIRVDGRIDIARIIIAFARSPLAALAFVRNVRTALNRLTTVSRAVTAVIP